MALAYDEGGPVEARHEVPRVDDEREKILARELEELLGEIRVILPGVTVLFAFLLTLPFMDTFATTSAVDRAVYFAAFMAAAGAMILLVAPGAYHRLCGKPYDKALMLRTASRQAIGATGLLAIATTAVVFLVTDVIFSGSLALPVAAATFVGALLVWFGLPLVRRRRYRRG